MPAIMGLLGLITMTSTDYKNQVKKSFTYIKAIQTQNISLFSASPVRIREQKEIEYFEVGASNITDSGIIIINKNDKIRTMANETSFQRQHLRVGDIIMPFRTTPKFGLIVDTPPIPLVPNTSIIVIRTNCATDSAYLCAFLNQKFVCEYLEYQFSTSPITPSQILNSLVVPDMQHYQIHNALTIMKEIYSCYENIQTLSKLTLPLE